MEKQPAAGDGGGSIAFAHPSSESPAFRHFLCQGKGGGCADRDPHKSKKSRSLSVPGGIRDLGPS